MKDDDSAHRPFWESRFVIDRLLRPFLAAMDAGELQAPIGQFCTCSHSLLRDHTHDRRGRWGICLMAGCHCRKGEVRVEKDDKLEKAK